MVLSSLAGLVPLPSTNPPLETVGYDRSSLRDFSSNLGKFSPARERERLRPRGGNAGAPGWRGTVWGSGSGSRLKARVRNNEDRIVWVGGVGEDTVVGHRGILTLDLDLDLNHDLDQSGPARTQKGNLSKSGCGFVLEEVGGEWLMPQDCPGIGGSDKGRGNGGKVVLQARDRSPSPYGITRDTMGRRLVGDFAGECARTRELRPCRAKKRMGGVPRAPLADSLCPGLTSGCAFGAKKGAVPTRGSKGRNRWDSPGMPQPRDGGLPRRGLSRNRPVEPAEGFPFDCGERVG